MGRHHRRLGILRLLCFASLGGRSALPNPAAAGLWTAIGTDSVAQAALTRGGCSGARFYGAGCWRNGNVSARLYRAKHRTSTVQRRGSCTF